MEGRRVIEGKELLIGTLLWTLLCSSLLALPSEDPVQLGDPILVGLEDWDVQVVLDNKLERKAANALRDALNERGFELTRYPGLASLYTARLGVVVACNSPAIDGVGTSCRFSAEVFRQVRVPPDRRGYFGARLHWMPAWRYSAVVDRTQIRRELVKLADTLQEYAWLKGRRS